MWVYARIWKYLGYEEVYEGIWKSMKVNGCIWGYMDQEFGSKEGSMPHSPLLLDFSWQPSVIVNDFEIVISVCKVLHALITI